MWKRRVGKVELRESVYSWRLEEFSALDPRVDRYYDSPDFRFGDRSWCLTLNPNGLEENQLEGIIGLRLGLCRGEPPMKVRYTVGIETAKGSTEVWTTGTKTFRGDDIGSRRVYLRGIGRSEVLRRRDVLLPQDVLTLTVTLREGAAPETVLRHVSVQAAVERDVADASVQTAAEDSVTGGRKGEPSETIDLEKLREHFKLWLEHPEEGDRIRRLRREELEKRWKFVEEHLRDHKELSFFAA